MQKELIVSSSSLETKVAIIEDGLLSEIFIEREQNKGILGNIYKGRVTRVLPGMQSAFVDIGLDRDAFLYVSDFFEDTDEYELPSSAATRPQVVSQVGRKERDRPVAVTSTLQTVSPAIDAKGHPAGLSHETDPDTELISDEEVRLALEKWLAETGKDPVAQSKPEASPQKREANRRPQRSRRSRGRSSGHNRTASGKTAPDTRPDPAKAPQPAPTTATKEPVSDRPVMEPGPEAPATASTSETGGQTRKPRGKMSPAADVPPRGPSGGPETAAGPDPSPPSARTESRPQSETTVPVHIPRESSALERIEPSNEATIPSPWATPRDSDVELEHRKKTDEPTKPVASAAKESQPAVTSPRPEDDAKREVPPTEEDPGDKLSASIRNPRNTPSFAQPNQRRQSSRRRGSNRRRGASKGDNSKKNTPRQTISELLREGQEIMVQVAKEPIARKGARLTSYVALPGRFLVYMPTVEHVGVSRKVESEAERQRLRKLVNELRGTDIPGGFIVRTAGENRSEDEIRADIVYLHQLWDKIRSTYETSPAPGLVHSELGLVERVIRDHLSDDFSNIRVDDEIEYTRILEFVNRYQPSLVERIKLFTKNIDIFDEFGVNQDITRALEPKIWLKSGGYIVINQTEALVAIDVNTGKYVGKSNSLEETITRTNLETVKEVVRQIRLRDLGGIIVIDFIDMEERKNRHRVLDALHQEMAKDRSPSKILEFNEFGLVTITRKRVRQSLEKILCQPCPYCGGAGMVKSITSICYQIHSEIQKIARNLQGEELAIRLHPEVAKALRNGESRVLKEMESLVGHEINLKRDESLHLTHFDIII